MVDFEYRERYGFEDLVRIMRLLRAPGGCPWDREQTHASIRNNFIEEVYEAVEAIDTDDPALLREELGDVLLQVVFHARMAEEAGRFDMTDVCHDICAKLIERHPHIFADTRVQTSAEVLTNWDRIKNESKGRALAADRVEAVPRSLPSLMRAQKVQSRAAKVGFDWPDVQGALDKIDEEARELREAVRCGDNTEEELGDLLFSAVNAARFIGADAEQALSRAVDKFSARFRLVEERALAEGRRLEEMTLAEMDALWDAVKKSHV